MADELDLYAHPIPWKKVASIFAVFALIFAILGFAGYRWVTTTTAVSRADALEIFREEAAAGEADASATSRDQTARDRKSDKHASQRGVRDRATAAAARARGSSSQPRTGAPAPAAGPASDTRGQRTASDPRNQNPVTPEEGVYSWDTEGWEEAAGIRRNFPEESQRIITASDGDSWKEHHYFSEEREIWTDFVITRDGAHVAMQRNRAKFGPVTNDSTVDFAPPMLVGLAQPQVGRSWTGEWKGRTSGTYTGRVFDHSTMTIGGETVEVWGYETRMQMQGELNGTVIARVMYSPKYAMTVQEHYTQNIETDRGRYRAEWTMTVTSTTPQR